jgi:CheY-like chemotaxis protein
MGEMGSIPRVLLVEDELLISAMVADVLAEHGGEVHVAANARDALQYLTCGAPCDVLFTDINLPGGIDGTQLAQLARELRPDLPVVYASGVVAKIGQLNAVPGAIFVAKPYDPEKVWVLLQKCAATQHWRATEEAQG